MSSPFASAKMFYLSYLRESCGVYSRNFYQTYFGSLETPDDIPIDSFCQKIDRCDKQIARRSIISYHEDDEIRISCISAFGFFFVAKVKKLFAKAEAEQFLQSWMR